MDAWRLRLLGATVLGSLAGTAWLWVAATERERGSLLLLAIISAVVGLGFVWVYRRQITFNVFTSHLALGLIAHVLVAGLVVAGSRFATRGVLVHLADSWMHVGVGVIGIAASLFAWAKARPRAEPAASPARAADGVDTAEPPPAQSRALEAEPEWDELRADLEEREHIEGLHQLEGLQRISETLSAEHPTAQTARAALSVVRQEVMRLRSRSLAEERRGDDEDVLSKVAEFFEWGVQKLPEIARLDVPDLLLAHVVAEIRATHDTVENVFVEHHLLQPIHPINRPTAEEKADQRAAAAQAAWPLVEANGGRLSEALIAAHDELAAFQSVTGFQVVKTDGGYVTFEGNGRAAALQRAFGPERPVLVEVRWFQFDDGETQARVERHIDRVQRSNGVKPST